MASMVEVEVEYDAELCLSCEGGVAVYAKALDGRSRVDVTRQYKCHRCGTKYVKRLICGQWAVRDYADNRQALS